MNTFSIQNFLKRGDTIVLTLRPDEGAGGSGGRQWDEDDTTLLLSLMEKFGLDFKEKVKKRKQIWMEIAGNLNSHGYPWSSEDCRKKWSNLLRTFKVTYDVNNDTTNSKRSRWTFYEKVLEILMSQIGMHLPEASTLVAAMNNFSPSTQTELTAEENSPDSSNDISAGVHGEELSTSAILLHQTTAEDDVTQQLQSFITSEVMVGEYGPDIEVLTSGHDSSESTLGSGGRLIQIHNINVNSFHPQEDLLSCCVISEDQLSSASSIIQTEVIPPFHLPQPVHVLPALVPDPRLLVNQHGKSEDKKGFIQGRRKRQKRERKTAFSEGDDDDPVTSRLISVTVEHNEKVLAQMKQFHEEVLGVMRERNKTLNDLCEFLKRS